jgi:hypothetical protein
MDFWGGLISPYGVAIVAIAGGILSAIFASAHRARIRELEIRERIAMIERGMVPPPETDPNGFEQRMRSIDRVQRRHAGARFRSGGIMVMCVGFGVMTLLAFLGVPREAMGVGGFLVFIGVGLLLNSFFAQPRPNQAGQNTGPSSSGPAQS